MVTPASINADVGQTADDEPVAYVDTEGEERVLWIRTDATAPEQSDAFPPEEAHVTLELSTTARWSSGASATTDETDTTEYHTDDTDTLTIQQPPQPQVTVFIPIHRPPNVGELIARFYDPCANNYLLTFSLRFGLPASAYEIYNSFQYPTCWWAPTCRGRCSLDLYRSFATTPSCYPAGQLYIQCFGLSVNGTCVLPVAVCTPQAGPGFCT